jgi:hypothetical protein
VVALVVTFTALNTGAAATGVVVPSVHPPGSVAVNVTVAGTVVMTKLAGLPVALLVPSVQE